MTGWILVWILVVRSGFDFIIIPGESPMPSFNTCIETKYAKEKQFFENPVEWGDFTSYTVRCDYRSDK